MKTELTSRPDRERMLGLWHFRRNAKLSAARQQQKGFQ